MNASTFTKLRLANQQLTAHNFTSVHQLVSYMGMMQAQDFAMSKWAVGLRLENTDESIVEEAINAGEVIRIHALRPTWHLIAAEDVHWMIALSAKSIKASMKSRDKQLELTDIVYKQAIKIIEQCLQAKHCTRDELVQALSAKNIVANENRFAHFMLHAELNGIACSGSIINRKNTYALMEDRIKNKKQLTKEEALKALVTKYFQSHGPAKLTDFMWWSGLTKTAAYKAVQLLDESFVQESFRAEKYWLKQSSAPAAKASALLLPSFDEYIISYKDRSDAVSSEAVKKVISSNGIFWPVLLANGKVTGKWSRKVIKDELKIDCDFFADTATSVKNKFSKSVNKYAKFLGKNFSY